MTAATALETRGAAGRSGTTSGGEGEPLLLAPRARRLDAETGSSCCRTSCGATACSRSICPATAGSGPLPRGATTADFAASAAAVLDAEDVGARARRRPLVRRARRAAAGAQRDPSSCAGSCSSRRPGSRPRPALPRRSCSRRRRSGPVASSRRSGTASPGATGTGEPSSGRGSSRIAVALTPRATHGLLAGAARSTRTRRRAGARDGRGRPAPRPPGARVPRRSSSGARATPQLPLEDAFEYARRLRAKLRLVADCGHLVIVERPHAVARRAGGARLVQLARGTVGARRGSRPG